MNLSWRSFIYGSYVAVCESSQRLNGDQMRHWLDTPLRDHYLNRRSMNLICSMKGNLDSRPSEWSCCHICNCYFWEWVHAVLHRFTICWDRGQICSIFNHNFVQQIILDVWKRLLYYKLFSFKTTIKFMKLDPCTRLARKWWWIDALRAVCSQCMQMWIFRIWGWIYCCIPISSTTHHLVLAAALVQ